MELYEILDTIVSYDSTKPWEVIIYQVVFYCLRNFCVQRVIQSFDNTFTEINWDNVYELSQKYCDPTFKQYLPDIFDPDHFNQINDVELLDIFCKRFVESLDIVIKNDTLENEFIIFLDETLFEYFAKILETSETYIFPRTIDNILNVDTYLLFYNKYKNGRESYNIINEPIEIDKDFYKKKSLSHALILKKNRFLKSLKHSRASLTHTRKVRFNLPVAPSFTSFAPFKPFTSYPSVSEPSVSEPSASEPSVSEPSASEPSEPSAV